MAHMVLSFFACVSLLVWLTPKIFIHAYFNISPAMQRAASYALMLFLSLLAFMNLCTHGASTPATISPSGSFHEDQATKLRIFMLITHIDSSTVNVTTVGVQNTLMRKTSKKLATIKRAAY